MYNYYVIEIQTNADGTSGNFVWGYADQLEAEDKFLTARTLANDSSVWVHTIMFIDKFGKNVQDPVCYKHPVPAPEPEQTEG